MRVSIRVADRSRSAPVFSGKPLLGRHEVPGGKERCHDAIASGGFRPVQAGVHALQDGVGVLTAAEYAAAADGRADAMNAVDQWRHRGRPAESLSHLERALEVRTR